MLVQLSAEICSPIITLLRTYPVTITLLRTYPVTVKNVLDVNFEGI